MVFTLGSLIVEKNRGLAIKYSNIPVVSNLFTRYKSTVVTLLKVTKRLYFQII